MSQVLETNDIKEEAEKNPKHKDSTVEAGTCAVNGRISNPLTLYVFIPLC
jgi:hypothetical protein